MSAVLGRPKQARTEAEGEGTPMSAVLGRPEQARTEAEGEVKGEGTRVSAGLPLTMIATQHTVPAMPRMLIDYYKAIEDSSRKMLKAAQEENWTEVVRYEGACAVLIEQLRHRSRDEALTPELRREKSRIMQRILQNDAEIRCLTEPWIGQFEHILESRPQLLH